MKIFRRLLCLFLVLSFSLLSFTACGKKKPDQGHNDQSSDGNDDDDDDDVVLNEDMTQLYIGNYGGGFGTRWLQEYRRIFEDRMKNKSYEPGKKGVQLVIDTNQNTYSYTLIRNGMENAMTNIYFTEIVDYFDLAQSGLACDITDVVKSKADDETRTIEDKLTPELKTLMTSAVRDGDGYDGKYYALPTYQSFRGITYDVDLFDEKGWYFDENGEIGCKLEDEDRSSGPNGHKGDYDDGLPQTFEQFFELCEEIKERGCVPMIWTGAYKESYTRHLLDSLYIDVQGRNEYNMRYSVGSDGTRECDIITGFDANGKPIVGKTTLTTDLKNPKAKDNYYETILRQKGAYYALDFMRTIITKNYYGDDSYDGTVTQDRAQADFLRSVFSQGSSAIAMLLEGTWWEEEANSVFEQMEDIGGGRYQRRLGFMPLPKIDMNSLGAQTLFNGNQAYVFINGNCDEGHKEAAKDFLKFMSSDEMLRVFTKYTGVCKDYIYEVPEDQLAGLSYYAKSVYDVRSYSMAHKEGGMVYGACSNIDNYNWTKTHDVMTDPWHTEALAQKWPVRTFKDHSEMTAREYFEGMLNTKV